MASTMIFCDRQQALDALKIIGRLRCAYAGDWPDNLCDCKYGGPMLMPHPVYGANLPHEVLGEQTGCPELRTIYVLLSEMTDQVYNDVLESKYRKNVAIAQEFFEDRVVDDGN